MPDLPLEFKSRMKALLGAEYPAFEQSYALPPQRAIRVNTLKIPVEEFKKISPFVLAPTPWEPSGFYVGGEGLGKTVLHSAGAYYVQEPSAMSVVPRLKPAGGERILDLCSAPGGKGTQIAQYMEGRGTLVLNEPVPARRDILAQNVERLGIKNAVITCAAPDFLAEIFPDYFDKILVDAPCSGEGMFKKEPNAIPEWSPQNVEMCAARQKQILDAADKMLCGGGILVYSTCTFSPREDEEQVQNFLKAHPAYKLLDMQKLLPHKIQGEGHFYALLQKTEGVRAAGFCRLSRTIPKNENLNAYKLWEDSTLKSPLDNLILQNGMLFTYVDGVEDIASAFPKQERWRIKQGVLVGVIQSKNTPFTPAHSLATRLTSKEANSVEVDEKTALSYLRGLTFDCPQSLKGWYLVTHAGLPLGWCKAVNGVAKNHLPKGLRIL